MSAWQASGRLQAGLQRAALAALVLTLGGALPVTAQDKTRTFDAHNFKYTLPADNWTFLDESQVPNAICLARSTDGATFLVTTFGVPKDIDITDKFTTGFDKGAADNGMQKRGGRLTTFKGLTCYETEGLINGKMTTATRVVLADGLGYSVQVLAGAEPVEKRSDYEAIMNGFDFLKPPAPKMARTGISLKRTPLEKSAFLIGQVVGFCVVLAVAISVVVFFRRKKQTP